VPKRGVVGDVSSPKANNREFTRLGKRFRKELHRVSLSERESNVLTCEPQQGVTPENDGRIRHITWKHNSPQRTLQRTEMRYHFAGRLAAFGIIGMLAVGAHAQTAVLNVTGTATYRLNQTSQSIFQLNQSFILNQIGFVQATSGFSQTYFYKIGNAAEQQLSGTDLSQADSTGIRYYTFANPTTYDSGTNIFIRTASQGGFSTGVHTLDVSGSPLSGVTYFGFGGEPNKTSGNIKVSNPGSNVAPEPGTFALALTGGSALLGICIRRRRNAA
jgi:hypothetical protein